MARRQWRGFLKINFRPFRRVEDRLFQTILERPDLELTPPIVVKSGFCDDHPL